MSEPNQIKKKYLAPEVINYFDDQIDAVEGQVSQEILDRQAGDASAVSTANAYTDTKHLEQKSYIDSADALKVAKAGDTMTGKLTSLPSTGDTAFETYKQTTPRAFGLVAREQAIAGIYNQYYIVNDPAPSTSGTINMTTGGNVYLGDVVSDANFKGSVWRIDNGRNEAVAVTVQSYNNPAFSISFTAPAHSRIFVISPVRVTHIMTTSYGAVNKSANTTVFNWSGLYGSAEMLSKTDIQSGKIKLTGLSGAPSMPSAGEDVAVKKYVDDQDSAKLLEAKSYADAGILVEKTRAEGVEAGLQSQINTEKGRIDAIMDASQADKDSFAEIVALINSVDLENDNALASVVSGLQDADSALSGRMDTAEGEIDALQSELAQEISDRQGAVSALSSGLSSEASDREAGDLALSGRLDALEANPITFHKDAPKTLGSVDLMFVDLEFEARPGSLNAFIGRLAIHEGVDYVLSVVAGKTRLTWYGSLVSPNGAESVEAGDKFYANYAKA
jgi:hypothetical protein